MTSEPVHILQLGSSVREIVNMVTIAVADAQSRTLPSETTNSSMLPIK